MNSDKMITVVMVGASGFVAKNVRRYLSGKNVKLISVSRTNFAKFKNEEKIIIKNYDQQSSRLLLSKIRGSDVLIDLVGIGRQSIKIDYNMVNVEFTRHIINISKRARIKRFIYLSGLGVLPTSMSGYFISKYKAEQQIKLSGLDYTIFRPSYIVGKDDLLSKYLKRQIRGKEIVIPGSGNYQIQPVHVDDVARVIHQAIDQEEKRFRNKTIDLVGPDCVTFEQYVKWFSQGQADIIKMDLERAYHTALTEPNPDFGVDDLNILVGNFKGDHDKLKKIARIEFQSVTKLLELGRFP